MRVTISGEVRISGDLPQFLARESGPGHAAGGGGGDPGGQELLTVEQTAEVLQISRDHVYGLLRSGELRSLKIGKLRRISRQRIADFIRQHEADAVLAENLIHAGQAACRYSWRMPPRWSCLRM
jgi:excisionase family DNA binding protein